MLHEDADRRIPNDQTGRTEPTPESLPIRTLDPRIARITLANRR
jgi:hypothetical protein